MWTQKDEILTKPEKGVVINNQKEIDISYDQEENS